MLLAMFSLYSLIYNLGSVIYIFIEVDVLENSFAFYFECKFHSLD